MKKKRLYIKISIIVVALFLALIIGSNIFNNNNRTNKTLTKEELNEIKFVKIKYLVMNKTSDEYDLKNAFPDHFDDYLSFASEYMLLVKDGDYYKVGIKDQVNDKVLNSITSYAFAKNNNAAEMLDDCIYDKDNYEIKIPASYFDGNIENVELKNSPVQIEFLTRLKENDIKSLNINVKTKNVFNSSKDIERNGKNLSFSITTATNQQKKNISVYLNGSNLKLNSDYYTYEPKTGKIEFDFSPILVDRIDVKINNNFFGFLDDIFFSDAEAYSFIGDNTSLSTYNISTPSCHPNCLNQNGTVNIVAKPIRKYADESINVTRTLMVANMKYQNLNYNATQAWSDLKESSFTESYADTDYRVADVIEIRPSDFGFSNTNKIYLAGNCIHITNPSGSTLTNLIGGSLWGDPGSYDFKWKVSNVQTNSNDVTLTIVFMLDPTKYYWYGTSTPNVVQTLAGAIKLKYTLNGEIKVQKKIVEMNSNGVATTRNATESDGKFLFNLYTDSSCTTSAGSQYIVPSVSTTNGVATFSNLTLGATYYVKENLTTFNQNNTFGNAESSVCKKVVVPSTVSQGSVASVTVDYKNYKKYYCTKIKKVDNEGGASLSGAKFVLKNSNNIINSKITGSNGYATFTFNKETKDDILNGTIKLYETESPEGYYGSSDAITISSNNIVEMTYSNNTFTCNTTQSTEITKPNYADYYCVKLKKVDADNNNNYLTGAEFSTTINGNTIRVRDNDDNNVDGIYTFFLGKNKSDIEVYETVAPSGYNLLTDSIDATPILLKRGLTESEARVECLSNNAKDFNNDNIVPIIVEDTITKPKVINWYKTDDDGEAIKNAEFTVKDSDNNDIYHSGKTTYVDDNNVSKKCYMYSEISTGSNSNIFKSDANGEICVVGVNENKSYEVTEVTPAKGYTFGSLSFLNRNPSYKFESKRAVGLGGNTFKNYPTEFEFTKKYTTFINDNEQLNNTLHILASYSKFKIYDSRDRLVKLKDLGDGEYQYVLDSSDTSPKVSILSLNTFSNTINVHNLPIGNYYIEELTDTSCEPFEGNTCYGHGFYIQNGRKAFTINSEYNSLSTAEITNELTSIEFTKNDLYSYINPGDVVRFENDEEIMAFDNIGFKIKDEDGNYLKLIDYGNSGLCTTSGSYSRYLFDPLDSGDGSGTVMHTCNGKIKIYGLCRNHTYTIEEVSVPHGTVFTLPLTHPTVEITIPETGGAQAEAHNKVVISDEPTRAVIEKRDSRNNALQILDQNAEFEVYRCNKNDSSCTVNTAAEKMKFSSLTVIDNEEAYRAIPSSRKSTEQGTYKLKLNNSGKIILRYLPADYTYLIYEVTGPNGFYQMTGGAKFKSFDVDHVKSKQDYTYTSFTNYPTAVVFTKSDIYDYYSGEDVSELDNNSKEFDKIKFRLYDEDGTLLRLIKVQDGEYRYFDNKGDAIGTERDLYTKDGTMTITHLEGAKTYYLEEYNADGAKEFILPNNVDNSSLPGNLKNKKHPIVEYFVSAIPQGSYNSAVTTMLANKPTRVVFKKIDLATTNIITDTSKTATFNVYRCNIGTTCNETNGTLVYFEDAVIINDDNEDIIDGAARKAYKYSKLNASQGKVKDLKLDNGYLVLRYLPTDYSYVLVETVAPSGYYNPPTTEKYTEFSVLSTTLSNGDTYALPNSVNNTPIELTFTKEDFYKYFDENDIVRFENQEEVKAFDNIVFRIKDSNDNVLSLCKESNEIVNGKEISVYSYLNNSCSNKVTKIKTKNGSVKIKNLYRSTNYKIEEVSVPSHSVFVLPETKPTVTYTISAEGTVSTNANNKKTISNVPTRVLIYKKDDRTNSNIKENSNKIEAATFEVYRCAESVTTCTKSSSTSIVRFMKKAILTVDDVISGNISDPDIGKTAYKFVSSSDLDSMSQSQITNKTTTSLELDNNGQILLKYLPANFKYVLVETNAPDGYYNYSSSSSNVEVSFEVINNDIDGKTYNFVDAHTEIKLTKNDIYNNESLSNDAFDSIKFVLRDELGNIVSLSKVQDGEYRYIQTDGKTNTNNITNINTKNGVLVITHLLRNKTYYIEEISDDEAGLFILPNNIDNSSIIENTVTNVEFKNSSHPVVKYSIPNVIPANIISNTISNIPTRVVFKKYDASDPSIIINDQNAEFEVYRCKLNSSTCSKSNNDGIVKFKDKAFITNDREDSQNKVYVAIDNSQNGVTTLKLNSDGRIILRYLSSNYNYILVEKTAPTGYYKLSEEVGNVKFLVPDDTVSSTSLTVNNYKVELEFKKEDIAGYYGDNENLNDSNVFDQIIFRLYDKNGNILNLTKVSDGIYSLYNNSGEITGNITDLHTKNGSMKITNIESNTKYYLEEYSVGDNSSFILQNNIDNSSLPGSLSSNKHIILTYDISESINSSDIPSITKIIENLPTRVAFKKIDSVTGNIVTDNLESATFNVYRCSLQTTNCNETNGELVYFTTRSLFNSYEDVINGVTVSSYRYNKSILSLGRVSDLKLDKGYLVLRYLPTDYNYVLVEKIAPNGYYNEDGIDKYTLFTVLGTTTIDSTYEIEDDVINTPTEIHFKKDDIYKYYDSSDVSSLNNNKVFDTMKFVLRDELGNILNVTKVSDGSYRYVQEDGSTSNNNVTNLTTYNGEFTISYLVRNKTYYIEEIESDTDGIFILPNNIDNSSIIDSTVTNTDFKNTKHVVVKYILKDTVPNEQELKTLTQLIENRPTRVVFEKKDALTGELLGSEDITFNLYRCSKNVTNCTKNNGELVYFENRSYNQDLTSDIDTISNPIYVYNYSKNNSSNIKDLHTDRGVLVLGYLPSGYKYVLFETSTANGYYSPTEALASTMFEIKSTTLDSGEVYEELTSRVTNTPTEIFFVKSDIYDYYTDGDISSLNDNTKLFDTMKFVLRDKNGNILKLMCTDNGEVVRTSGKCTTGEYRYLPYDNNKNYLEEINTINGRFKITYLEKGETYYIEEVKSDTDGIFILPNYLTYDYNLPFNHNGHPVVKYTLPLNEPNNNESVTRMIENTPSRVLFEKRDSVYGYLVTDETTTFNVYRCDKTVAKCTIEDGEVVYFENRAIIPNDNEDSGLEVYKYSKNNDENKVKDLHPYNGKLILRYLSSDYNYVLVETVSPTKYTLPQGENAYTYFTISDNSVTINPIDVPNKPTSLLIRKYSDDGELLEGAEFAIYEGVTCDVNKKAIDQPKTKLKLRTIRDGIYENSGIKDTDIIKTCIDKDDYKCNDMTSTLTLDTYVNTWTNFENSINQLNEKIEIQAGEALIQYLEYGKCYIIEEVKAPKGYSLPEKVEDRFIMVTIDSDIDVVDTYKELINKPTPYTFYKYNEYNELIDGGEYKLQKLNSELVYEDVYVSEYTTENNDRKYYKVDNDSDNTIITTLNGTATIYYLSEGQYRIIEIKAPENMELPIKELNMSTFYVSKSGVVTGSSVIVNKPKTEKTVIKPKSSAELIVNISTGKDIVKFGLIIGILVVTIFSMIIFVYKKKK